MRAQPKRQKKRRQRGERNISNMPEQCYKAVIMPENEKWNKVVGARKGEAETETKSWKFRAPRASRSFVTYAKSCGNNAQLKHRPTAVWASVRFVRCEREKGEEVRMVKHTKLCWRERAGNKRQRVEAAAPHAAQHGPNNQSINH